MITAAHGEVCPDRNDFCLIVPNICDRRVVQCEGLVFRIVLRLAAVPEDIVLIRLGDSCIAKPKLIGAAEYYLFRFCRTIRLVYLPSFQNAAYGSLDFELVADIDREMPIDCASASIGFKLSQT